MKLPWPQEMLAAQAQRLELVANARPDLTDKQIAEKIGVSPQAWNNYTAGTRPLHVPAAIELQKNVIPVTLDWLYTGDESGLSVRVLDMLRGRARPVPLLRAAEIPARPYVPKRTHRR